MKKLDQKQIYRLSVICALVGVALWLVSVGVIIGWLFPWGAR